MEVVSRLQVFSFRGEPNIFQKGFSQLVVSKCRLNFWGGRFWYKILEISKGVSKGFSGV